MRIKKPLPQALFVALIAIPAFAEDLVTDRPDATESSSVIKPSFAQLEVGYTFTDSGTVETHEIPQTLLRVGLIDRVELRLGWDGVSDADPTGSPDGVGDGELGTKIYLRPEDGRLPETALLASMSLPFGENNVTSDEVDPGFRFSFAHTLSDTVSLGYNLGAEWATEADSTLGSFIYTVALGVGLSETVGVYVEVYGEEGLSASGSERYADGGFTYLLNEDLQLDLLGGVGLSEEADDWFVGAGFSYRFGY